VRLRRYVPYWIKINNGLQGYLLARNLGTNILKHLAMPDQKLQE